MSWRNVLLTLESELRDFPSRAPAPDLYTHLTNVASTFILADRSAVSGALREWIRMRTEPRTMIAIHIAHKLLLHELRPEIEELRRDVIERRAFLPYYVRWVDEVLSSL